MKSKHLFRNILVVVTSIFIIAMVFIFLLFSSPVIFYPATLTVNDTLTQSTTAAMLYQQILDSNDEESATLTLSPQQLNAIIGILSNGAAVYNAMNRHDTVRKLPYSAKYEDNSIKFIISVDTRQRYLVGGAIIISGSVMPTADGEQEFLRIDSLKIGAIPMPGFLGEWVFDAVMEDIRQFKEYKQFRPVIIQIEQLEDGAVKIVYKPFLLKHFLPDLQKVMRGSR